MKSLTINLAAAWGAAVQTFVDGDVFRESNIDLQIAAIADRLGYLKTAVDDKAALSGVNVFTGINTFDTDSAQFNVTGAGDAVFANGLLDSTCSAVFRDSVTCEGPVTFEDAIHLDAYMGIDAVVGADASGTLAAGVGVYRVPALTANRVYVPPTISASDNRFLFFTRPGSEAFSAGLSGVGAINAGSPGWLLAQARAGTWVLVAWGGTVSSLSATV